MVQSKAHVACLTVGLRSNLKFEAARAPNHRIEMARRKSCAFSVPSALRAPAATHSER